jgi:hypothetical protein
VKELQMNAKTLNQAQVPAKKASRRGFLLGAGATAGGAVVAAVAPKQLIQNGQVSVEPEKSKGYAVTDHVRSYYRSAVL